MGGLLTKLNRLIIEGTVSFGVEVGSREAELDTHCWNHHLLNQWFILGTEMKLQRT